MANLCWLVCVTGPFGAGVVCLTSLRDGCTALHRAVEGNQHRVLPMLLTADPQVANIQDRNGQTVLHFACRSVSGRCIDALLVWDIFYLAYNISFACRTCRNLMWMLAFVTCQITWLRT